MFRHEQNEKQKKRQIVAAGDLSLSILLSANAGNVSSVVSNVTQSLSSLAGGGALGGIVSVAAGAGAALVGMGANAVKAAGDFQSGMTSLVTGAGEAEGNIKQVSAGILQLSTATGTSTKSLTAAMYEIESSGQHGAAGLNVLKAAAQGAKVGNADLDTVAKALTTTLTDYHMPASQATSAMNGLVAAVAAGKTHMQDMASAMGNVLPLASSLHISFPQVAGAISTMTNAGMSAQRASMNLSNAIRSLAAPGASAQKSMQEVGLSAQQLKNTLSNQGLAAAIQLIEDHVSKKFPAGSVQAVAAFKAIMGGATGYNVALMLGGKNMEAYESNIKSISAAMGQGKGDVQGWALVQQDFNFQVDRAKAALQAFMIILGEKLLPIVTPIASKIGDIIGALTNLISGSNTASGATTKLQQTFGLLGVGISYIKDIFSQIAGAINATFGPIFQKAGAAIQNFMSSGIQPLIAGFNGILFAIDSSIGNVLPQIMKFITNTNPLANLFEALSTHAQELSKWFQSSVVPALQQAQPGFMQLVKAGQSLLTMFGQIGQTIHNTFQAQFSALLPVFERAIPLIIKIAGVIADGLGRAIQFLAPYIAQAVAALGQFAAEITQRVAPIITQWLDGFSKSIEEFKQVWTAVWPFLAPILRGVWDEIVGIVKVAWALVSGIIKIGLDILGGNWKQAWTDFKDMLAGVWDGIKTYLHGAWEIISGVALAAWAKITETWGKAGAWFGGIGAAISNALRIGWAAAAALAMGAWNNVSKFFQGIGNGITNTFKNVWSWITTNATAAWNSIRSTTTTVWTGIMNFLKGILQDIVGWFKWLYDHNYYFHDLVNAIQKIFTDVFTWLKQTWQSIVTWLTDLWKTTSAKASEAWKTVTTSIQTETNTATTWLKDAWTKATTWLAQQWNSLKTAAADAWKAVSTVFSSVWTTYISTPLANLWKSISQWWTTTTTNVVTASKNLWTETQKIFASAWTTYISTPFTTLMTNIQKWFTTLGTNFQTWAGNAMKQFATGITNGMGAVTTAVTNVGTDIAKLLGFHSPPPTGPLATSNQWMPNMMTMFAQGITNSTPQVTNAVTNVGNQIKNQFTNIQNSAQQFINTITNNLSNLKNTAQTALNNVNNYANQASQGAQQASNSANLASQSNQNAQNWMTSATQAAQTASYQADAASQNSLQASTYAQTASQNSQQASSYAQTASQLAQQSSQSSRQASQGAQQAGQNAQQALQGAQQAIRGAQQAGQGAQSAVQASNQAGFDARAAQQFNSTAELNSDQAIQQAQKAQFGAGAAGSFADDAQSSAGQAQQGAKSAAQANNSALISLQNVQNIVSQIAMLMAFHSPPEKGPLSDSDKWMGNMVNMFEQNLLASSPKILNATSIMAKGVKQAFQNAATAAGLQLTSLKQKSDDIYATLAYTNTTAGIAGTPGTYITTTAAVRGDIPVSYQITPPTPGTPSSTTTQNMTIHLDLDGKTIGKVVTKYQEKELRVQGVIRSL